MVIPKILTLSFLTKGMVSITILHGNSIFVLGGKNNFCYFSS